MDSSQQTKETTTSSVDLRRQLYDNEMHYHVAEGTSKSEAVQSYLTNKYYQKKHLALLLCMMADSKPVIPKGLNVFHRANYIHAWKSSEQVEELSKQTPVIPHQQQQSQ